MKKTLFAWFAGFILLYAGLCLVFYLNQEDFGLHPEVLSPDHVFQCEVDIEELTITMSDGIALHGVLAHADSSHGLILFLHGSGGNIDKYMEDVPVYTHLGYDIFYLDYRGYGKSEGSISSEEQFKNDMDVVYSYFNRQYAEASIIIAGFSMGTFAAAYLASKYDPGLLILESPPYWILERFIEKYFFIPVKQLSRYQFETYKYVEATSAPIRIFLGSKDPLSKETRWNDVLKPTDKLIILEDAAHQNFAGKDKYMSELQNLLSYSPVQAPHY